MAGPGTNSAAPALREGVRCSLELAGAVAQLDCVVVEFDETDVHLAVAALDAEGRAALAEVAAADISTGGCRLRFTAPWPAAGPATIRFALGDASEMRLEARLVRVDGLEASFAFTDPGSDERRQLSALVRAYNAAA